MPVMQQLDFGPRRDVLQHQRDVIGFDAWDTHVTRKRLSGDDDRNRLLESQYGKERFCTIEIPHHNGEVVEVASTRGDPPRRSGATIAHLGTSIGSRLANVGDKKRDAGEPKNKDNYSKATIQISDEACQSPAR